MNLGMLVHYGFNCSDLAVLIIYSVRGDAYVNCQYTHAQVTYPEAVRSTGLQAFSLRNASFSASSVMTSFNKQEDGIKTLQFVSACDDTVEWLQIAAVIY